MRRRREQRDKRLKEGFAELMARRIFMLEIVVVTGFGLMEIVNRFRGFGGTAAASLGGLLVGAALAGIPVLLISARQFRRHREGDAGLDIAPFQLYSRVTLVVLLALLAGWGVCALLGV